MPVAKTYQSMPQQGEPFEENKRMYVYVLSKNGAKKVRWYTEDQYARMYPNQIHDIMDFNAHHAFGFDAADYITIFKGDQDRIQEWASDHRDVVRYNLTFLNYVPSRFNLPQNIPADITPIRLKWSEVRANDTRMRPHDEVTKQVHSMIVERNDTSEYQGEVGDWITKSLKIIKNISKISNYGEKHLHVMKDSDNNIYIWETGAKNFVVNSDITLQMKVKGHTVHEGAKTTIVWYCKEVLNDCTK